VGAVIDDPLLQLHQDIAAYLRMDEVVGTLPVLDARTEPDAGTGEGGAVQDLIERALAEGGLKGFENKAGMAVVVLIPDVEPESQVAPGPDMNLICAVRVHENRIINEGSGGFGVTASQVAVRIAQVLHLWAPSGTAVLIPARRLIADLSTPNEDAFEVTFQMRLTLTPLERASQPAIEAVAEGAGARVTLAHAGPGSMFFTLDGSMPGTLNPTALEYEEPFLVEESARLRVITVADGLVPSTVNEALLTIS
jgi:hypothetical protein